MLVVTGDEATVISSDAGLWNSNRFLIEGVNYFSPFPTRLNLRTLWNMVKACAVLNVVTGRLSPAGRPISWECAKKVLRHCWTGCARRSVNTIPVQLPTTWALPWSRYIRRENRQLAAERAKPLNCSIADCAKTTAGSFLKKKKNKFLVIDC